MHTKRIIETGIPRYKASKALIMLHGRGASANDILSLQSSLDVKDFYIAAPQAMNSTWYPYSFLAPITDNEPWLTSAIELVGDIVVDIEKAGITSDKIFILGFSQGACLSLEFSTRNARKWGGVISFTGGLIGDKIYKGNYGGDFKGTKVFIGNSDHDPHVPLVRSEESKKVMTQMGASVNLAVYPNMSHTINKEEIEIANQILNSQ